jgi:hypothetical protein
MLFIFFLFALISKTKSVHLDGSFHDCIVSNHKINLNLSCQRLGSEAKRFECEALENALTLASNNEKKFHKIRTPNGLEIFYSESNFFQK